MSPIMEFNLNVKKKRLLAQISLRVATKVLVNMICPNAGDRCFVNARQWNTWIETLDWANLVRSTQTVNLYEPIHLHILIFYSSVVKGNA